MRIWVDLTNSPHVLVLRPIIAALREQGHDVELTARDFAQTFGLLERFGLDYSAIGHHRGGKYLSKATGLASRSLALTWWARGRKFDLAFAHGSNDISVAAKLLGIPSVTMFDYEWARVQHNVNCRLAQRVIVPQAIPPGRLDQYGAAGKLRRYEGLKEEYYLADFEPDSAILTELKLDTARPIIVLRTPPSLALYHRVQSDVFSAAVERLAQTPDVQVVALPRIQQQREALNSRGLPNFIIPDRAIDAQSLIAYADLVIGAGGTMNREAVALGTPVYTTFAGRLGGVDEALLEDGRMLRLESAGSLEFAKRDDARVSERIRRDPADLAAMVLH